MGRNNDNMLGISRTFLTCLSLCAGKYLFKVKSRNTIFTCWLWSTSATKTPERCHAVFIFNFEHIQQINLNFLLLILDMYMSVTFTNGKKRNYIGDLNGEEVFSKVFLSVFFGLFFCFLFSWRLLVLFLRRLVYFLLIISVTFL